ncbi:MFS transporter [Brevibacterium luteolum]|uniref:MFS transporter n=1 Tax=Brevibacterium luteolum TaxID=199591 RepID=UPI0021AFF4A9|nr:MFS transporter [Brevibacterium luteolum]MCT1891367.1 MFS transporter [Brevibacterium luteolum]MCT1893283.1 MFS transporter [Brevibacterium luteolum]MCT1923963.1 MFS transporter [Brevibacterium luteolum]
MPVSPRVRSQLKLIGAQLFAGAGIASGYAVGGLLAEQITGRTEMAGFAQMAVILGAGLISYPLATLAGARGRRFALSLGFGIGAAGTVVVLFGVIIAWLPLFLLGMLMCGSATAAGLQARYAAVDLADPARAARAMSLVVWATTIGSVLGPNFTAPGAELGAQLGLNPLAGPYVISMVCFALAVVCTALLPGRLAQQLPEPAASATVPEQAVETTASGPEATAPEAGGTGQHPHPADRSRLGLIAALRFVAARPIPLFAIITIVAGQMMMTNVMVMTPLHMDHHGFHLGEVGLVISIHIAGMYGLSPVFGWMADRYGPFTVIITGIISFFITIILGVLDALREVSSMPLLTTALFLLGVSWSMTLIGGSALLSASVPARAKLTLQGASDSAMNLGGALMAATAGTVLGLGGFLWINLSASFVLLATVLVGLRAALYARRASRAVRGPRQPAATHR